MPTRIAGVVALMGRGLVRARAMMRRRRGASRRARDQHLEDLVARRTAELAAANAALRRSEARLRAFYEQSPLGIERLDAAGRLLDTNPALTRIVGYSAEELRRMTFRDLTPPGDLAVEEQLLAQLTSGTIPGYAVETHYRHRDGHLVPVRIYTALVADDEIPETHRIALVRDLVEQRATEAELHTARAQLAHVQKLEAVGQLAGGIAHDFNNILSAIMGYAGLLDQALPADDARRTDVQEIHRAAQRAAGLTRQLLTFSRRQLTEPNTFVLPGLLDELQPMLRRLIREDIRLVTRCDADAPPVYADPAMVEQVIVNLAVNARDAMPEAGTLSFEVDHVFEDGSAGPAPGGYAMLTVRDTGSGMDEATRARVFEPFFTTKPVGEGTGLGLAMVYGAVQQWRGYIEVDSAPGEGAAFRLFFPRSQEVPVDKVVGTQVGPVPLGHEHVLLVEDDSAVRRVLSRVLRNFGYRVDEAETALEALAVLARDGADIDLVVTDVVMPGMNGRVLGQRIGEQWPGLPIIYMSGYTNDATFHRDVKTQTHEFLQKPFEPESLVYRIQEVFARLRAPRTNP